MYFARVPRHVQSHRGGPPETGGGLSPASTAQDLRLRRRGPFRFAFIVAMTAARAWESRIRPNSIGLRCYHFGSAEGRTSVGCGFSSDCSRRRVPALWLTATSTHRSFVRRTNDLCRLLWRFQLPFTPLSGRLEELRPDGGV